MGISNDYRIDALLRGADARWNSTLSFGTPTEVTYGFMDAVPSYFQQPITNFSAQDYSTFLALDSAHRDLVRNEFAELSKAIPGLKFTEVSDPNAAIIMLGALKYDVTSLGDAMGYAPNGGDSYGNLNAAGDIWFNLNSVKYDLSHVYVLPDGTSVNVGKVQFEDMALHEIGHALGLKHPGNYTQFGGGGVGSNAPPYLPANEDNSTNTVMSYNGDYAGQELRPYDILALDFLYGATAPSGGQWVLSVGGSSVILGSSLNELIIPRQGAHSIDGGAGVDTVSFSGNRQSFSITHDSSGKFLVADNSGSGVDTLVNIERLQFYDAKVALDISGNPNAGFNPAGLANAGQVYRLYQAAFNRAPDKVGLAYWIGQADSSVPLTTIASGFTTSVEFKNTYGNLSEHPFVDQMYQNVLHRAGEPNGVAYWYSQLDSHTQAREQVLVGFSESTENQAAVIGVIQNGIDYTT